MRPMCFHRVSSQSMSVALQVLTETVAVHPSFSSYPSLLRAWYTERKQQLEKSLGATVENGKYVTEGNRFKIFIRDWYLWMLQLIPSWKHWLEMGQRREGMVRYQSEPGAGMAFLPEYGGGGCFPQVYCTALTTVAGKSKSKEDDDLDIKFTDDVIFAPSKKALFQLVALLNSIDDIKATQSDLRDIDRLSNSEVLASETTFLIHDATANPTPQVPENTYRIATGEEFAKDKKLCGNRPKPEYYDMLRMKQEAGGKKYVVLRPDRFVFALCDTKEEVEEAVGRIEEVLKGEI